MKMLGTHQPPLSAAAAAAAPEGSTLAEIASL